MTAESEAALQNTPLRFAANLKWMFTEHAFEHRFEAAASAGFTGVEFASPYAYAPLSLAKLLKDAGLTQVLINSPMGAAGTDAYRGAACLPRYEKEFRDGIDSALEYAAVLGCEFVHVVAGVVPPGLSREQAFAQYVESIAWAADRAEDSGVKLVLENQNKRDVPGFLLQSQAEAASVVELVGSDRVGTLFDFYHAQLDEGGIADPFTETQQWISHIQIADAPGRHEPGTGMLDWNELFHLVIASGYSGWIGCEYEPINGTVPGLAWMKEFAV